MKLTLKNIAVTIAVLIVVVSLAGCGGSSKTWPDSNHNFFAYLVDTSSIPTAGVAPAARSAHAAHARQMAKRAHRAAAPRANAGVDIETGSIDVYVWDVAAATSVKLNTTSAAYESVVLSADYKTVYFTAYDSNGYGQIFSASVTNFNSPTQLTTGTTEDHDEISISQDGTLIATTVYSDAPAALSIMASTGGTETIVAPAGLVDAWLPNVAADDSTIVFEGVTSAGFAGIYSVKKDGTGLTRLTNAGLTTWDWDPTLSPDGKQIAFAREVEDSNTSNVYVVAVTGETTSAPATAVTTDGDVWEARHLGNYVAYTDDVKTYNGSGNYQLFLTSTAGTGTTQLTTVDETVAFMDISD